jgi:hypothetical protein
VEIFNPLTIEMESEDSFLSSGFGENEKKDIKEMSSSSVS